MPCLILSRARACHFHTTRPINVCHKKNKLVNTAKNTVESGTRAHVEVTSASGDVSMIGQVGGG